MLLFRGEDNLRRRGEVVVVVVPPDERGDERWIHDPDGVFACDPSGQNAFFDLDRRFELRNRESVCQETAAFPEDAQREVPKMNLFGLSVHIFV